MSKKILKIIAIAIICAIILLMIGEKVQAQIKQDAQAHFAFGAFSGIAISGMIWQETGNRWIAAGSGLVSSVLVGYAKEKYDQNHEGQFSERDFKNTILGGVAGCMTFQLILGRRAVHKKNIPIYDRWKIEEQLVEL